MVPTARPDIDLREVAQSNIYVTLSITKDHTTYTTTILLAGTETVPPSSPSTIAVFLPTSQNSAPITAAGSTDPSSGTVIGAIVGAIVGSFVFALLLWCCFYSPALFGAAGSSTVSGSESSSSRSTVKKVRVRVRETRRARVTEVDDN